MLTSTLAVMLMMQAPPPPVSATLTLDHSAFTMENLRKQSLMYTPGTVKVQSEKPVAVKKEPAYRTAPKYAVLRVGNGPNSETVIALDEPENEDARVYVDKNRNGDLTDDGDGAWNTKKINSGIASYGPMQVMLRASYGTAGKETSSSPYGLEISRTPSRDTLVMTKTTARIGKINIDGQVYVVALHENDHDGIFDKKYDGRETVPVGTVLPRPVNLWLTPVEAEIPQGNPAKRKVLNLCGTFNLNGWNRIAYVSPDGSKITIKVTPQVVAMPSMPRAERPTLLAAGLTAPDFTCFDLDSKPVKLSDYKGKVVVLDFWATWCGPCKVAMPGIEKIHRLSKDKGVVVLGVCVWDERKAFDTWVPENKNQYTFKFVFDPAGRNNQQSVASALYRVSGIPTTFIINPDGKIASSFVGSGNESKIIGALQLLGISIKESAE